MTILERFFGPGPKKLFLDFTPYNSYWRVVSWNFNVDDPSKREWTLEVRGENSQLIKWGKKDWDELQFYRDSRLIKKRNMGKRHPELISLMNLAIHSTLKYSLELNHAFMLTPVSGATAIDIQNETRALQWIQASFTTLTRALDNFNLDSSLILTAACFSGKVPETEEEVFRVIVFNLDIFFYLRPDFSLQIVVFDDKNLGHGESKTPSFQQIIKVTKPQFYDEISKLVYRMAQLGEIR